MEASQPSRALDIRLNAYADQKKPQSPPAPRGKISSIFRRSQSVTQQVTDTFDDLKSEYIKLEKPEPKVRLAFIRAQALAAEDNPDYVDELRFLVFDFLDSSATIDEKLSLLNTIFSSEVTDEIKINIGSNIRTKLKEKREALLKDFHGQLNKQMMEKASSDLPIDDSKLREAILLNMVFEGVLQRSFPNAKIGLNEQEIAQIEKLIDFYKIAIDDKSNKIQLLKELYSKNDNKELKEKIKFFIDSAKDKLSKDLSEGKVFSVSPSSTERHLYERMTDDQTQEAFTKSITNLRESLVASVPEIILSTSEVVVGDAKVFTEDTNTSYWFTPSDFRGEPFYTELEDEAYKIKYFVGDIERTYKGTGRDKPLKFTPAYVDMCDQGAYEQKAGFTVASLNDGNGWGKSSQMAAQSMSKSSVDNLFTSLQEDRPKSTQELARRHDEALFSALGSMQQLYVLEGQTNSSTTCPQLLTLTEDEGGNPIVLVSSIGDTSCFVISKDQSQIRWPTADIRGGENATDPGGRVGLDKMSGEIVTDVRNYTHTLFNVFKEDTILMASDGLYDCLDPKHLLLKPSEVDPNLKEETWDENNPQHAKAKNDYIQRQILIVLESHKKKLNKKSLTPSEMNDALLGKVRALARGHNLFLLDDANKGKKIPRDMPGKPDHVGMVFIQVGEPKST